LIRSKVVVKITPERLTRRIMNDLHGKAALDIYVWEAFVIQRNRFFMCQYKR